MTIQFLMAIYREPAGQLAWCAQHLRNAYPKSPVTLIADGRNEAPWREVCALHDIRYVRWPERLKAVECGGRWWQRLADEGTRVCSDRVVKMDPDTLIRRPLAFFPEYDLCGSLQFDGVVQGGFQVFTWNAILRIARSGVCLDPAYVVPETWAMHAQVLEYARSRGEISTDYTLAHIARRLELRTGNWPEVDSRSGSPKSFRAHGVCVSHPHKGVRS